MNHWKQSAAVANKDKAVAIQGIATSDFENNIAEFKKRAHTVKLK